MENYELHLPPYFDAQTMMGTLPIQHYASVALDNHLKGISRIIQKTGKTFTRKFYIKKTMRPGRALNIARNLQKFY